MLLWKRGKGQHDPCTECGEKKVEKLMATIPEQKFAAAAALDEHIEDVIAAVEARRWQKKLQPNPRLTGLTKSRKCLRTGWANRKRYAREIS